jgi:hypothetical protein
MQRSSWTFDQDFICSWIIERHITCQEHPKTQEHSEVLVTLNPKACRGESLIKKNRKKPWMQSKEE